jgi:hypothetical protein
MNKVILTLIFFFITISSFGQNKQDKYLYFGKEYLIRNVVTGKVLNKTASEFQANIWIEEKALINPTLKIEIHSGILFDDEVMFLEMVEISGTKWYKYAGISQLSKVILSTHDLSEIGNYYSAKKMLRIDDSVKNTIFVVTY